MSWWSGPDNAAPTPYLPDGAGAFANVSLVLNKIDLVDPSYRKADKFARGSRASSLESLGHMCFKVLLLCRRLNDSSYLIFSIFQQVIVLGSLLLNAGTRKFARGYRTSPFIMEQEFA